MLKITKSDGNVIVHEFLVQLMKTRTTKILQNDSRELELTNSLTKQTNKEIKRIKREN